MELLEREPFLDVLRAGFQKTVSGEGHSFFITGEAGIGKSSLVKAFVQEVKDRCSVYLALCDFLFTPRPLGPIYDLALQINKDVAAVMGSVTSRMELFANLVHAFTQGMKAVVIVIEDIHWADEATLDFIKYFARRITHTRCLFLLTYRDDEITSHHPLRNVLGELPPGTFSRIQLPLFSRAIVQKLAAEKGYSGEDLFFVSGGNPFYVNEILASYSPGIPDNVKDAILSLYNRQKEPTKNVWQALSIMPDGLEYTWLGEIEAHWREAIEDCLSHGILLSRNGKAVFKHELFRRTIELALSPFKRMELNKHMLHLFLERFKKEGAIERIVHYAKNASENKLVSQYAPLAAKQAASVGAHVEAAKLYLVAIEYADEHDPDDLVQLYEAYTYECYLTNQIQEAIIYQGKALKMWQAKGNSLQVGNTLRFLSRLWWFEGRREESERYGLQAIELFESQPASKAKAMAWSNMAQLKMLSEEVDDAVRWGKQAMEMARELGDDEIVCHALNNVGAAQLKVPISQQEGKSCLEESLRLALQNSFHEHVARAYTNLIATSVNNKDYNEAEKYLGEGLYYCEERDLHAWTKYILSWKVRMLMEIGRWKAALAIAKILSTHSDQLPINKIGTLVVQAIIGIRSGDEKAVSLLQEAKVLAFVAKEHQRIIPVAIAAMEYEWLTTETIVTKDEFDVIVSLIEKTENIYLNLEAVFWMYKARPADANCKALYHKYQQLKTAEPVVASAFQKWTGRPYEKAILLFDSTEDDKRKSLSLLQDLGATAVCEKLKSEMRSSGIKKIPRGVRVSTKSNPAQLTSRELDILQLLKTGAQNKEIAGRLFISPKTVDHHISSILFKLDVPSRTKAVREAELLGIIK